MLGPAPGGGCGSRKTLTPRCIGSGKQEGAQLGDANAPRSRVQSQRSTGLRGEVQECSWGTLNLNMEVDMCPRSLCLMSLICKWGQQWPQWVRELSGSAGTTRQHGLAQTALDELPTMDVHSTESCREGLSVLSAVGTPSCVRQCVQPLCLLGPRWPGPSNPGPW